MATGPAALCLKCSMWGRPGVLGCKSCSRACKLQQLIQRGTWRVCLMQGRDDVGRPLLERALRIQEAALGPDHPDVVAIRDVLNSEDE